MKEGRLRELRDEEELKSLLSESNSSPVVLFKHSLTCPISANAYREMNRFLADGAPEGISYHMIVVQHARLVSNAIARILGVEHESPQVILVRNGKAVWHA